MKKKMKKSLIPSNELPPEESAARETITQSINDKPHTQGIGHRAHITLGCAKGVSPVTTGRDLIMAVKKEQTGSGEEYKISGGGLRNLGDGVWVFYPEYKLTVSSIFTGMI